ncbi:sodium channel and clathrin linker 1, partial [Aplysia californica]
MDAEFLRDQVSRLTVLLARYQEAYPDFVLQEYGLEEEKSRDSHPWITESKELSPLLREYDATIYGLQEQLGNLQEELMTLRSRADLLVQENDGLRHELRESVQSGLTVGQGMGGGDGGVDGEGALGNLQQQVEIAVQEKDAAQEKWREAAQEVDRLEAELEVEKESHQWRVVEQQAHQVKDQYHQSVTALGSEVETLHTELRETRTENSTLVQKVSQLKLTVSELQQQLVWKSQETADNIFKEGVSDSKISELKRIMDELRHRLSEMTQEAEETRRENNSLHTRLTELQRRLSDTEVRENEAVLQVREAVQLVEAAVIEKDQAEMLVRQKEEELEETKTSMAKLIVKAGARTREEVDNVRAQCNERIAQLTEEVHALEMEGSERQARLDRLVREKRAVESELQQIYSEGKSEGSRSKEAYEQLNKRAIDAERARDEASVKVDNMQT